MAFTVKGNLVDVHRKEIYPAEIVLDGERIRAIEPIAQADGLPYILPGFIDAHVHIESSMLIPSEFARLAVPHGTVATVSDPHEIANVCGMQGIDYMITNGNTVPFKFNFGAPSCVPATRFETAGAVIDADQIEQLMRRDDILYLSEMMNFPGVLQHDPEVMKKIAAARKHNKPVDGHAPGLTGTDARNYINAGISTDHECFTLEEALGKLNYGMHILIREGSAAKNFEALAPLIESHPDKVMFCSDDKHPDSLVDGHINLLCKRAAEKGFDLFNILQAACVNPVKHYKLKVGLLRVNDFADFILVNDLTNFEVMQTYINGCQVAANGRSLMQRQASAETKAVNNFSVSKKTPADFAVPSNASATIEVIAALDGQLITLKETAVPKVQMGKVVSDPANDILKIAVVNRYRDAPVATGFIRNFGLKKGAIASSVAHDSHNIVAVGVDDESICNAVNLIIDNEGGVSCADHGLQLVLGLPVAGLMSQADGYTVAKEYASIDQAAKALGATLSAPFMTLSFMALLVIPHLKLSDKGLFDGDQFRLL